jgi:trypsin
MNDTEIYDRIAGGYLVSPAFKYPFMILLVHQGGFQCSGTLISLSKILTAAHCTKYDIKGWKAMVHRQDLSKTSVEENGMNFQILKRRFHPNFNPVTRANDVAVWTVFGEINAPYYPILDDGTQANKVGNLLSVIGWGSSVPKGYQSNRLMQVEVPIVDNQTCQQAYLYPNYRQIDSNNQICAGYQNGGKDACTGDSGGPAFITQGAETTIVGITSFGKGCALPNIPGIYTKVAGVKDWIMSQISN